MRRATRADVTGGTHAGATAPAERSETWIGRALLKERTINARRIALIRAVILGLFLAYDIIVLLMMQVEAWGIVQWITVAYFTIAALIYIHSRSSQPAARLWTFGIPALDMPMVFLIQYLDAANYDLVYLVMVYGYVSIAFALLITLSILTLSRIQIIITTLVGVGLTIIFGTRMNIHWTIVALTPVYLVSVGTICLYARGRLVLLARRTAEQQLRRERLRRFFSPAVAQVLEDSADPSRPSIREVTVLFADLRGFTDLSSRLREDEVVALLNEYHTRMAACVFEHGGTLDKFIGDGILAYFGAPLEQPDHAERAVRSAMDMQKSLAAMNRGFDLTRGNPLHMGIGLHTGRVTLGAIGPPNRRDYTIIGEAVNIASRIEQSTKVHEQPILLSEPTRAQLPSDLPVTAVAEARLRGVRQRVQLYTPESDGVSRSQTDWIDGEVTV